MNSWDQLRIDNYISNEVEEGLSLEYKAAAAIGKSDSRKKEITKDISSFANSAGGIALYGVKEFDEQAKEHLPESVDPINRVDFPREWLEHVIGNIRPRIHDLVIHPVQLESGENHVVYVVEIPMSTTAHQAQDFRYYRRYNFESVPMLDHEIRDVMNRSVLPDADVVIDYSAGRTSPEKHHYKLRVKVVNTGPKVIRDYKLRIVFPNFGEGITYNKVSRTKYTNYGWITGSSNEDNDHVISFMSREVLFPSDEIDVGHYLDLNYIVDEPARKWIWQKMRENELNLEWTLYADDMKPKFDSIPFSELHQF